MTNDIDRLHAEFDVEQYQAEHKAPSERESAFITIAMFASLIVFAIGCYMMGWFDEIPNVLN